MSPDTLSPHAPVDAAERLVVDDPAAEAAPVARRLAGEHCHTDAETGQTCGWYHGYMLYKSLLVQQSPRNDGRSSVGWKPSHAAFYLDEFRARARSGAFPNVLVSASSDYMMPSLVFDAYSRENTTLNMTLVDICETPLYLSRWYAARRGFDIATVRSDIFDYEPEERFDLLCTHHFLNFISPARRPALFRKWRRTLREGGRVAIINSVRPVETTDRIREYGETRQHDLEAAVNQAEKRLGIKFPPHEEFLAVMSKRDTQISFYPVQSADEIADLMCGAGFTIDRVDHLDSNFALLPGSSRRANKKGSFGLIATAR